MAAEPGHKKSHSRSEVRDILQSSEDTSQKSSQKTSNRILQQPLSFSPAGPQGYVLGLRGFWTVSSFLWVFLTTFAPVTVKSTANREGPFWQEILRNVFSPLFWNPSLIYSAFIIISARLVAIPFLLDPTKSTLASAIFRRGLRLWFPVAVSLAIVKILSSTIGTTYIDQFKEITGNGSINAPYSMPNTLAYFNSVFNLFWTTHQFFEQAGNTSFPSQTLWAVNVIYAQSYTVYMTIVIIPYTRNTWRVKAYIAFIITAWWVQSWAWYTITGLLFADVVMNMRYKERAQRGIKIWRSIRCPVWIPAGVLMLAGFIMQYLWTSWRPAYENKELLAHTGLYYSGGLNTLPAGSEPQARDDCYLIVLGLFLILESTDWLQRLFQSPMLLYLGRRSLSWMLTQSIITYSAGIKLHQALTQKQHVSDSGATAVTFFVILPTVIVSGEIFYRLVDWPSQNLAHIVFDWIRE